MNLQSSDLILRFDANSNEVLLLVPKSPNEVGTLKRFFSVPVPVKVTVSDFAGEIGVAVASFLHARHGDRFKVVESEPEGDVLEESEDVAFDDVRLLIDRFGDNSTLSDLQTIDTLLKHASERGSEEAIRYLRDTWPGLRAVFVRRISRRRP
ncbi:hypothetical protein [Piscinibacter sp.]|uniref:hypothetical protein n=1 Tax=Piscinibacter sp. TaxID=1903157 RepID=UPI0039E716ED